jgi:acyl dehydratase
VSEGTTSRSDVIPLRRKAVREDAGIVRFKHYGVNQHDKLVFEGERTVLMKRRAAWGDR